LAVAVAGLAKDFCLWLSWRSSVWICAGGAAQRRLVLADAA
jgi:hypothetical protein